MTSGSAEFQYLYFSPFFYAFLNEPGCLVMSVWCPDDNFNCFQLILMIFGIYVIWVKIFDGIEYEHHISLNMRIMADHVTLAFLPFLTINFSVRAFKLEILRDLRGTFDISSSFCQIPVCVFFQNFYAFPNNLAAHSWLVSIPVTQFPFYWI